MIRPFYLSLDDIADAPSMEFSWISDGRRDVGSIAQYWARISPHLAPDMPDGMKGLQYGKAALMAAIAEAREIRSLKQEVRELKQKVKQLEEKLNQKTTI